MIFCFSFRQIANGCLRLASVISLMGLRGWIVPENVRREEEDYDSVSHSVMLSSTINAVMGFQLKKISREHEFNFEKYFTFGVSHFNNRFCQPLP